MIEPVSRDLVSDLRDHWKVNWKGFWNFYPQSIGVGYVGAILGSRQKCKITQNNYS